MLALNPLVANSQFLSQWGHRVAAWCTAVAFSSGKCQFPKSADDFIADDLRQPVFAWYHFPPALTSWLCYGVCMVAASLSWERSGCPDTVRCGGLDWPCQVCTTCSKWQGSFGVVWLLSLMIRTAFCCLTALLSEWQHTEMWWWTTVM